MDFRYHCLTLHYRTPMNFTWEAQAASRKALARLREVFAARGGEGISPGTGSGAGEVRRRFREAILDDLNAPKALAVVHEAARSGFPGDTLQALAGEWDEVLGIGLPVAAPGDARAEPARPEEVAPGEVGDLARLRDRCRREGRYAEADALREKIREAGYDVLDRKGKPARLKRI